MGDKSGIEWTDATWNPVAGCAPVSPGCLNCYAATMAGRLERMGQEKYAGTTEKRGPRRVFNGRINLDEGALGIPLGWKRPRRIFVNSMSDLFHEDVPWEFVDRVFAVMALARNHAFQILTKRPGRMRDYMLSRAKSASFWKDAVPEGRSLEWEGISLVRFPLRNVWLGVSVEDQRTADERIPLLLKTPTAVRFVSYEPALGPVDFHLQDSQREVIWRRLNSGSYERQILHWIIAGGESGPGARPAHPDWFRSARDQCQAAGVAFFMKQITEKGKKVPWEKWPEDLRVRDWPSAVSADQRTTAGMAGR